MGGLFKNMPKELSNRLLGQVRQRLTFLSDEGFQVSVEFGQFNKRELKIAANIQVWMVDELDQSSKPREIMTKQYGYKEGAAQDINKDFTNVTDPGPGKDFKTVGGITADQISDDVPGTSEPVFVKIPIVFRHDELNDFKSGNKEEAQLGIDEISATASHEIGHVLRSEPGAGHATGNFNEGKQSFPPQLMDKVSTRNPWQLEDGTPVPRFSTEANDTIEKEQIDKLGGWPHVRETLVLPNVGDNKIIRRYKVTDNGDLQVWYNEKNLGYAEDEKVNMIEFLKGIEMSQQNHKWDRKK
jgi:hypothetical protein